MNYAYTAKVGHSMLSDVSITQYCTGLHYVIKILLISSITFKML